jgi:hypothetical protein
LAKVDELVECPACKHAISPIADSCSGCGRPQQWTHPEVSRLLASHGQASVPAPWRFHHTRDAFYGSATVPNPEKGYDPRTLLLYVAKLGIGLMFILRAVEFWCVGGEPSSPLIALGFASILLGMLTYALVPGIDCPEHVRTSFVARFDGQHTDRSSDDDRFWSDVKRLVLDGSYNARRH